MNHSQQVQEYLSDIGVSGRIKQLPPWYRLTLSGKGRGKLLVDISDMGREPILVEFARQLFESRPFNHGLVTDFFSECEIANLRRIV